MDHRTKAILIDFDGVIRHWPDTDTTLERRYCLPLGTFKKYAFRQEVLEPAIRGTVTDAQWRESIAECLVGDFPDIDTQVVVGEWSSGCGTIDTAVIRHLSTLHERQLVLTTNATSRLNTDLEVHNLSGFFTHIINSSKIGSIKPEALFFEKSLAILQLEPAQVVFIDDSPQNTQMASSLGIRSHTYTQLSTLIAFLDTNGITPPSD